MQYYQGWKTCSSKRLGHRTLIFCFGPGSLSWGREKMNPFECWNWRKLIIAFRTAVLFHTLLLGGFCVPRKRILTCSILDPQSNKHVLACLPCLEHGSLHPQSLWNSFDANGGLRTVLPNTFLSDEKLLAINCLGMSQKQSSYQLSLSEHLLLPGMIFWNILPGLRSTRERSAGQFHIYSSSLFLSEYFFMYLLFPL